VRQLNAHSERELALADGLVLTGAMDDLHPRLYGARPGPFLRGDLNAGKDRADLAVLVSALALDLPIVGVCRGHQLMNIASGGTLYQDVVVDGATRESHDFQHHPVTAYRGSETRRLVGRRRPQVWSEHHQAVRRLGRRLRIAASSPDGVIESIERTDRRFALGLQWHPEREFHDGPGGLVAEALVEAAAGRRAA
jgi:gamma-glutamyl-gamma-aminobutyrate hydrolase PuuD